tara:strand:- start:650 stop:1090 length:441 start_codon:yes stop_codon:yes gene_type:complete
MEWVIRSLNIKKNMTKIRKGAKNYHHAEFTKLKFCENCKKTWERTCTGTIALYDHLPTYGLLRKSCDICKKGSNVTYKKEKDAKMTKKEIKDIFKENDVQLGKGSVEFIDHEAKMLVKRMAIRCKQGNVKRLTPELMYIALGKLND